MDIEYLVFLQNLRENIFSGNLNAFFTWISTLGEELFLMILLSAFYWCINKKTGIYLMFSFNTANFFNRLIKSMACIYRPYYLDERLVPIKKTASYSFPSAHTERATAIIGGLGYKYRKDKAIAIITAVTIVLIAFSRNFLGAHTPQDVIVSIAVGFVLLILSSKILDWSEKGKNRDIIISAIGAAATILLIIYVLCKSYPVDYVDGKILVKPEKMMIDCFEAAGGAFAFFIAWPLEKRLVNFSVDGSIMTRIVRFLIGAFFVAFFVTSLNKLLDGACGEMWSGFITWFITVMFISLIYPLIFKKVEESKNKKKATAVKESAA